MLKLDAVLDYETKCRLDLGTCGAIEYAKEASIFCLGYKINEGPCKIWIPERGPMPDELWQCFLHGTLSAHNAAFERAITQWCLTRYPLLTQEQCEHLINLPISQWRCTAAKAAMSHLPRKLEMAAMVLGLPTQKDMHGSKLIKKYCKPRKPSKHNPKLWWDDRQDLRDIYRYCLVDVQAEYELDQALPDLSPYEQKVWELDQKVNDRGILIDIPTVKIILGMISEEMTHITREVRLLSNNTIEKVTQTAKVLAWVNRCGTRMANLQAQTIRDKLDEDDVPPSARQMLEYRQGGSKTSTAKYLAMLKAVGTDHRARELLLYCGTMPTARWSGKRIQPHNFPRPTIKDFDSDKAIELIKTGGIQVVREKYGHTKVMDVLVCTIRGMLIASFGYEMFCADFASVEARLAFWLAEHEDGLIAFNEGRKLYEEMAAEAFQMPIEDVTKDSLERFVGKESVLGCQYGLGWKMFKSQCHKKGMKTVTDEIAKKAVYTYRKVHSPIPDFWKKIEQACVQAILHPGKRFRATKVVTYMSGDFLNIKLPSGRRLRYFKPRITQKQLSGGRMVPQIHHWSIHPKTKQWAETVTWGGVLTNHCVQGIARDLMVNGILNIEEAGYRFLLSVHDEGVAERKKGLGNLKEYISLMTQLPAWAEGAPITASGWVGKRYRKG